MLLIRIVLFSLAMIWQMDFAHMKCFRNVSINSIIKCCGVFYGESQRELMTVWVCSNPNGQYQGILRVKEAESRKELRIPQNHKCQLCPIMFPVCIKCQKCLNCFGKWFI